MEIGYNLHSLSSAERYITISIAEIEKGLSNEHLREALKTVSKLRGGDFFIAFFMASPVEKYSKAW